MVSPLVQLLLRLALIQALLEGRREAEALEEAQRVAKFEADEVLSDSHDSSSCVVSYLLGCCLLRLGERARGLSALERAQTLHATGTGTALLGPLRWLSPMQQWGGRAADRLLLVHTTTEKRKAAAVEVRAWHGLG